MTEETNRALKIGIPKERREDERRGLRCKDRLRARDGLILWPGQAEIPNRRLIKRASLPPPTASIHSLNWPFLNIRIISTRIYGMDASLPTRLSGGREDRE